jgi:CubicO group peptidase (beta-lactamase class C family)
MVDVHGSCLDGFTPVRTAFEKNFADGLEVGASVAVTIDGELVVDLWAGSADQAGAEPWTRDTITNVWSTTKTMTALCALLVADRGELDLHAPVARYWPEFAAAGKEEVQVRQLLGHTSGLAGWDEPLQVGDLCDWEKVTSLLAGQAPWWPPGSASGYHAVTQGFLVGEVLRRITGQTLGTFFAEQFAKPLGADFHIGLPAELHRRAAPVIPPPEVDINSTELSDLARRTLGNPPMRAEVSATSQWRQAEIPAANGHGNARSVAAVQSVLACEGTLGGREYLSAKGCAAVFEEQSNGRDLVLGIPLRFGLGYGLSSEGIPLPGERTCAWGGWGGSLVLVDLDNRMVVAYVMNRMQSGLVGDNRGANLTIAAYQCLLG